MAYAKSNRLSLAVALDLMNQSDSGLLAGGTDYYPGLADAAPDPSLLNIFNIEGLDQITLVDGQWRIGAAVTWTDLIQAELPLGFNCLKQAGREVGSIQIQNAASLVGNLCNASPAADGVPALLALGATVELSSVDGVRELALSDFITGVRQTDRRKNELVTAILVPDINAQDNTEFSKLGSRTYLVISIVMCSSRIRVDASNTVTDAAVAVGACSPVACRLPAVEHVLIGKKCNPQELSACLMPEHFESLSPISDVRATADYRLQVSRTVVRRQIAQIANNIMGQSPVGVS